MRDACAAFQRSFDLAQLDPLARHLDLKVETTQVFDVAVRPPAGQVTRFVHRCVFGVAELFGERVCNETRRGQLAAPDITVSDLDASDAKLPGGAHGGCRTVVIQNVKPGVRNRPADEHRPAGLQRAAIPVAHVDSGLCRAVEVVQPDRREAAHELGGQACRQGLAGADHLPHGGQRRCLRVGQEQAQHRGHEVQRRDAFGLDQVRHVGRVEVTGRLGDHQCRPGAKRREELHRGDVERKLRLLKNPVSGTDRKRIDEPVQLVHQASVRVLGGLGLTGGARGVDRIDPVARPRAGCRQSHFNCERLRYVVNGQCRRAGSGNHAVGTARGQHQGGLAIVQHEAQAVRWVSRVHRHIGRTGLERGKQGHHHLDRARHADCDEAASIHATGKQTLREAGRAIVQLAIRGRFAFEAKGYRVRVSRNVAFEQRMNTKARARPERGRQVECADRVGGREWRQFVWASHGAGLAGIREYVAAQARGRRSGVDALAERVPNRRSRRTSSRVTSLPCMKKAARRRLSTS